MEIGHTRQTRGATAAHHCQICDAWDDDEYSENGEKSNRCNQCDFASLAKRDWKKHTQRRPKAPLCIIARVLLIVMLKEIVEAL